VKYSGILTVFSCGETSLPRMPIFFPFYFYWLILYDIIPRAHSRYRRYSYFLMGTHSRTGGSVFIIPYVPKSLEENLTLVLNFRALSKLSGRSPLYSRSFSSFELYIRFIAVSLFIELAREVYGGAKYRGEYGPAPFIICR